MNASVATRPSVSASTSPLAGTRFELTIRDLIAEFAVSQRYVNDESRPIEAIFTFPMAMDATFLGLTARIGERTLTGTIAPRQAARETYEEAVARGDAGVLLERQSADLYTASLGNVKPGEAVELTIRFGQLLRPCDGRLRLTIPTTVAPRYGRSRLEPQDEPEASLTIEHRFGLEATVSGLLHGCDLVCPTHASASVVRGETGTRVSLSQDRAFLDRDLVLSFSSVVVPPLLGLVAPFGDRSMLLAAVSLPSTPSVQRPALSVAILVDCSGSMQGDSIRLARSGLVAALGALEPRDWFTVIRFGSDVDRVFPSLMPVTDVSVKHAHRAIASMDANLGGTELGKALDAALDALKESDGERIVYVLSDGETHEVREEAIVARAKRLGVRIFAVGVGAAPCEAVLRPLAERTGGRVEFVTPGEAMSARIERHFARLGRAVVGSIDLVAPSGCEWRFVPGNVVAGETVWIAAACGDPNPDAIEVRVDGDTLACGVAGETGRGAEALGPGLRRDDGGGGLVAQLAAALRLSEPAREAFDTAEFAVRHGLLTEQTACVLVAERKLGDVVPVMPATRTVPHMLAAGWGGTGNLVACMSMPRADALHSDLGADYLDVPMFSRSKLRTADISVRYASEAIDAPSSDDIESDALAQAWAQVIVLFTTAPGFAAFADEIAALGHALESDDVLRAWLHVVEQLGLFAPQRLRHAHRRSTLRSVARRVTADPALVGAIDIHMSDRGLHARVLDRFLAVWKP